MKIHQIAVVYLSSLYPKTDKKLIKIMGDPDHTLTGPVPLEEKSERILAWDFNTRLGALHQKTKLTNKDIKDIKISLTERELDEAFDMTMYLENGKYAGANVFGFQNLP